MLSLYLLQRLRCSCHYICYKGCDAPVTISASTKVAILLSLYLLQGRVWCSFALLLFFKCGVVRLRRGNLTRRGDCFIYKQLSLPILVNASTIHAKFNS